MRYEDAEDCEFVSGEHLALVIDDARCVAGSGDVLRTSFFFLLLS